jgi:hypothetical protein
VKVSHLHSINEHLTAHDRVIAGVGEQRHGQQCVDTVQGGVSEAVRDDPYVRRTVVPSARVRRWSAIWNRPWPLPEIAPVHSQH